MNDEFQVELEIVDELIRRFPDAPEFRDLCELKYQQLAIPSTRPEVFECAVVLAHIERLEALISVEGDTVPGRYGQVKHPAYQPLAMYRAQLSALLKLIGVGDRLPLP